MKLVMIVGLAARVGLTAYQKHDTDTAQQDKTTSPHSMDKDK